MKIEIESDNDVQYMMEMATVGTARGKKDKQQFLIQVNPSDTRVGGAYIKVYNKKTIRGAKVVRLGFDPPVIIKDHVGPEIWDITKSELDLIDVWLTEESEDHIGFNNWTVAKYLWNYECHFDMRAKRDEKGKVIKTSLMRYNTSDFDNLYKSNPKYVASILPIPCYAIST